MHLRRPDPSEVPAIGIALAAQQADPAYHIGGFDCTPAAIAEQLIHFEPAGLDGVIAAYDADALVGLLAAEWDDDPPRVWWNGPFVLRDRDWDTVADALYERGCALLPPRVVEQELASDDRHRFLDAFARRHGFVAEEASAVLTCELGSLVAPDEAATSTMERPGAVPAVPLTAVPLTDRDRDAVAALHDQLFSGTHVPGARLDAGRDRIVLVAHAQPTAVVGYVAAERQEDGDGYLDYLGVDPAWRRRGAGALLVRAACDRLRDDFACRRVNLTVRESNTGARRLYSSLGFVQERILRPFRRGFSLA